MKITNLLIFIVIAGVFISIFSLFLNVGVNNYGISVDPSLNSTLQNLTLATSNDNLSAATNVLNDGNSSITDTGVGEILQYKKASSLVTTVQSVKPVTNSMFSAASEYLNVPEFIKVGFGAILSISFLSFGVYLILGRKP